MKDPLRTNLQDFSIRFAGEEDVGLILRLITELAAYEKMEDQVVATEETLRDSLFVGHHAEVLIAEYRGEPVGFALFFHNFSTFLGKAGLYLEDLYLRPEVRGKGFGRALFTALARLAVERDCGRMEWACLDWNIPSIRFYKAMGAVPMSEWTVHRLTGDALRSLAE
ncbi:GNAT family N-acetyltransferase [Zongyangia hominis]|uniref:GNAT family N-acetyltransferase n=1 Tax=Zongyangia hominis TaxID=2763677 RepID=A0A926EDQ5_9FIRM|nr:GNAT family N-acetyltransferase [Zongyangia hominis]MBC8570309.1 GNAT family N-acetyltransferase [Zongyangia hominis]